MHYALVIAVAFGVTFTATPIVTKLATSFGVVKQPGPANSRHVHTRALPDVGGIALFLGFVAAMFVASRMYQFDAVFSSGSEPLGVLCGATVMFLVGLLDDVNDVSPPAKIAGMVVAASLMARFGVTMFYFRVPFNLGGLDTVVLSSDLAPLVTVLWVVLMANAINLIDGLDGLAAGIVMIAGMAFYLFARQLSFHGELDGSNIAPLVALIAVGICIGFLPHNWSPAKIIMGDSGALFLGLLMAVPTITVGGRTQGGFFGNAFFFFAPLLIPLVILGVPVADTVFSFFRRVCCRAKDFQMPTANTCIIASWKWVTGRGGQCSFCGPGPRYFRVRHCYPYIPNVGERCCRSPREHCCCCSTFCSTLGCGRCGLAGVKVATRVSRRRPATRMVRRWTSESDNR